MWSRLLAACRRLWHGWAAADNILGAWDRLPRSVRWLIRNGLGWLIAMLGGPLLGYLALATNMVQDFGRAVLVAIVGGLILGLMASVAIRWLGGRLVLAIANRPVPPGEKQERPLEERGTITIVQPVYVPPEPVAVEYEGIWWVHDGHYPVSGNLRARAECPEHRAPLFYEELVMKIYGGRHPIGDADILGGLGGGRAICVWEGYHVLGAPTSRTLAGESFRNLRTNAEALLKARLNAPPTQNGETLPEMRVRAKTLSMEIRTLLADRRQDDPSYRPYWAGLPRNASKRRKTQAFQEHSQTMIAYSTETMSRYDARFKDRALKLFDDFVRLGLADKNDRRWFEHPPNPLGIEEVATILGTLGEGGSTSSR